MPSPLLLALAWLAPLAQEAAAPSEAWRDEAWVVESRQRRVRFENDGSGAQQERTRVRIQSEAGVRLFGQLVQVYASASEDVRFDDVRILRPDGSVRSVPLDHVIELTSPVAQTFPVYSDRRERHLTVPDLRVGDVLEFGAVRTIHTPLAPGHFWYADRFDPVQVTLAESLEIDVPRARALLLNTRLEPTLRDDGERRVYGFRHQVTDAAALRQARRLQARRAEAAPPDVALTSFGSWEELGAWYQGLARDRLALSPALRAKADELTRGLPGERDKAQAIYDYVATQVRYVAIAFGQGAVQPHAATETLANGYGDCKDKHTLLQALLAAVGIRADAALIGVWRDADPVVPYLQFDHAVSVIRFGDGRGDAWVDTTLEVAPFGWLAPNLRGHRALVVPSEGAARLLAAPTEAGPATETRIEVEARLDDSGRYSVRQQRELYRGDAEVLVRASLRLTPAAQWKAQAEKALQVNSEGRSIQAEDVEISVGDPAATRQPLEVRASYSLPRLVDFSAAAPVLRLAYAIPVLPPAESAPLLDDGSLLLGGPALSRHVTRIELPQGWTATPGKAVDAEAPFAEYHAVSRLDGSALVVDRTMTLKSRSLPAQEAARYDEWRARVVADLFAGILLDRVAVARPPDVTEGARLRYNEGLAAIERRDWARAVEDLERAVELVPDHPDAWSALGWARLGANLLEPAIAALEKQVALVPTHAEAQRRLLVALLQAKRSEDAERVATRLLELKPQDAKNHWMLGEIRLGQRRFAEALGPLRRAVELDASQARLHVTLARAQLGLGEDDAAFASLETAARLQPDPLIWNDAAYRLAVAGLHLDRAQEWAESAIVTLQARLRSLPAGLDASSVALTRLLAANWDTLGLVHLKLGDLEAAERYLRASLAVVESSEVESHWQDLRAKRPALGPVEAARVSAGGLGRPAGCAPGCSGTVLLALGSKGTVSAAKHSGGEAALQDFASKLVGRGHDLRFPDAMPTQAVVGAQVVCPEAGDCRLELTRAASTP